MARVVLHNVAKFFAGPKGARISAVKDVSLTVEDQEFVVLVGPSGCGKSTTLRLIAGLEEINGGTISIDGRVVNDVEPKDRDIAMVFQNYALYPHMTVYENMAFGLKLRKVPKDEIERRVKTAAEALGLATCLDRLPKALSGGQRQRVAVGRALVRQPKVFLFDEPLSNLDAQMRVQMRMEISRLHQRLAATMIYVTHDQVEAMTMGDRIVVMHQGEVQQVADPQTLYNSPANKFVAGFIGTPPMNFFLGEVTASGNVLSFRETNGANGFTLPLDRSTPAALARLAGQPVFLGVRPEHISEPSAGGSAAGQISGVTAQVEFLEPTGAETYLHLSTGAHPFIARVGPAFRAAVGERVTVRLDAAKASFFDAKTGVTLA